MGVSRFLRAWRRHHRARLKNTRLRYYGGHMAELAGRERARALSRVARTPALCSCFACGNPRRQFGARTRAEACSAIVLEEECRAWWEGAG